MKISSYRVNTYLEVIAGILPVRVVAIHRHTEGGGVNLKSLMGTLAVKQGGPIIRCDNQQKKERKTN
jgi:hypothetical protein